MYSDANSPALSLAPHYYQPESSSRAPSRAAHSPSPAPPPAPTTFVRALYDFTSEDPSCLRFQKDDILELVGEQQGGWWDAILGGERGWIPSNHVQEVAIPPAPGTQPRLPLSIDTTTTHRQFLQPQTTSGPDASRPSPTDYWVPRITPSGQVFYHNTRNGESSAILPTFPPDSDSPVYDGSWAALALPIDGETSTYALPSSNLDVADPRRMSRGAVTPTSWIRRLAGDGITHFYQHKSDGRIQWHRPEEDDSASSSSGRTAILSSNPSPSRSPLQVLSPSASTNQAASPYSAPQGLSPYSTQQGLSPYSTQQGLSPYSTQQGLSPYTTSSQGLSPLTTTSQDVSPSTSLGLSPSATTDYLVTPSIRSYVHINSDPGIDDFRSVSPDSIAPPDYQQASGSEALVYQPLNLSIEDMALAATASLSNISALFKMGGDSWHSDQGEEFNHRLDKLVVSLRNLLYATRLPLGETTDGIPSLDLSVSPPKGRTRSSELRLKPAQRKVTSSLSKFVLMAHGATSCPEEDPLPRLRACADELAVALDGFVNEIRHQRGEDGGDGLRALHGAFSHAGEGGDFDWLAPVDGSQRALDSDAIAELNARAAELPTHLAAFTRDLDHADLSALHLHVKKLMGCCAGFVELSTSINFARVVDLEGSLHAVEPHARAPYADHVRTAQRFVRQLEVGLQALRDDAARLFALLQTGVPPGERARAVRLCAHLGVLPGLVRETFEALLDIAEAQAAEAGVSALAREQEDVVDMAMALPPPSRALRNQVSVVSFAPGVEETPTRRARSEGSQAWSDPAETPLTPQWGSNDLPDVVIDSASGDEEDEASLDELADSMEDASLLDDESVIGPSRRKSTAEKSTSKLQWLMGDDAPRHYLDSMGEENKPWYLKPLAGPNDIIVEPDGSVRGGTISALVERLTTHEKPDTKFNQAFLMTFKSFMTLEQLIDRLVARFALNPPENLTDEELDQWTTVKHNIVQTRVLNVFRSIVLGEDLELEEPAMLERIKAFASSAYASSDQQSHVAAAKALIDLIKRVQNGYAPVRKQMTPEAAPNPIPPRPIKRGKFSPMDAHPLELARQLSVLEMELFQKVKPAECFLRATRRHASEDSIAMLIRTSNRISNWLADCILGKEDAARRGGMIKHFIEVADQCRQLNNFSSMWAIVSGLNRPHISRLKRSWEHIDSRTNARFKACEALTDPQNNFQNYRAVLDKAQPPGVPFFGRFMTTLTFIEDGAPDLLHDTLVNFGKRQRAADVVTKITRWQSKPYNLREIPAVQSYIREALARFSDDEHLRDYFWNLSLRREKREREEDKMNRLLFEAGFL